MNHYRLRVDLPAYSGIYTGETAEEAQEIAEESFFQSDWAEYDKVRLTMEYLGTCKDPDNCEVDWGDGEDGTLPKCLEVKDEEV